MPRLGRRQQSSRKHCNKAGLQQSAPKNSAPLNTHTLLDVASEYLAAAGGNYAPGAFEARISTFSTRGGVENSSSAFAKSALAMSPVRWASRPVSSLNVS